jgi:hypothetical protein
MVARKVCRFPRNHFISAAAGPWSGMPIMASGFGRQRACIAAEVLNGAQLG